MSTEFVGIELELMGADAVRRDLQNLDRLINSLGGKKRVKLGMDELKRDILANERELKVMTQAIKAAERELSGLKQKADSSKSAMSKWGKAFENSAASTFAKQNIQLYDEAKAALDRQKEAAAGVTAKLQEEKMALKEVQLAARTAGDSFMQTFKKISSVAAHIGSAMQSFGNAITQLASPFSRLTDGILLGAGYKVLNSFTEGFERGFTRYDTMKKYPKIMAAFGYSAEEADKSINALDMSVRGLPTGLDEMVDLAQRFTATTGDLEKGTKLAIATNNAFLASMSTDTQKYQGMMQLQDVLGGKDMNAREWNSLVSSMTPAIVKMGEAMQESGEWTGSIGDFIQHIRDGKMDNQEFINQLIAIGNEGGVLEKMAQESKDTWQAFFANVGNAASRMTAGIIKSMDEVVKSLNIKDKDGNAIESVNMLLSKRFIPAIDNTTASIQKWIKAHPEEIKNFFKDLSKIDFRSFLKGFAQGLGDLVKAVDLVAKLAGNKGLSLVGRFFGNGRGIGRAFTIIGGLLKGTRHIWGFLGAGGGLLGKLLGGKIAKTGIFGKIASIFGKKKDIETAGDAAKSIPTVADTFKGAFNALQGLITTAGAVTLVAGTGFVAFKATKSILNDLKDIGDILQDMTWLDAVHGVNIVASIGVFAKIFSAFGEALGPQGLLGVAIASAASFLVTGAFAADMWAIKQGVINIRDTILEIDSVGEAITNMKGLAGINTGAGSKLQTAVNAIREISDVLGGKSGSPMDRGEYSRGLPMFTSFKLNSIKNIASAVKQLQGVITSVNEIAVMGINPNVASRMDQVKRAVQAVEKALPGMMTNINGPANLAANTKSMATGLKGLITMVKRINALASQSVNVEGFGALVQGIKDAMAQLEGMSEVLDLNIEVKLSDKFQQSVTSTIQKIKQAKKDIQNQTKAPVSFNIPVTVTFSVTTNLASALASINRDKLTLMSAGSGGVTHSGGATPNAGEKHGGVQQAKGGLIYRAKGGGVGFPGRPIGTDRVPAWLTPGEYVHNKRAVNTFGIDFMRKVNNLDVKGAMNELMHRAGHMANVNRGSVVNNTYNNNQKVVINNNNAGAGYTFKAASRFVGAF